MRAPGTGPARRSVPGFLWELSGWFWGVQPRRNALAPSGGVESFVASNLFPSRQFSQIEKPNLPLQTCWVVFVDSKSSERQTLNGNG